MNTLNIRQCDVYDNSILKRLQKLNPVSLNTDCSDESFCVVITQDCDIVHPKIEEEPFVEFITGNLSTDRSCKNTKNPRKLHLENNGEIFEFIVHNRFFVKKESLAEFDFGEVLYKLTEDNKKILKKWLGNRYTRAAFPDAFNSRLSKANNKKILEKPISSHVSHIFFDVEDCELSEEQNYNLNIMIVIDDDISGDERDRIEENYLDFFESIEGIEFNLRVVTEEEVTLQDLKKYRRWDKDFISFSKKNQSLPIEEIDKVV